MSCAAAGGRLGVRARAARPRRSCQTVRANNEQKSSEGFGLGREWQRLRREMNKQVDFDIGELNRELPPVTRRPKPLSSVDDIKREEQLFLNLWVKEDSFKLGGLLVAGMLFVFAIVSGPPLE